MIGLDLMKRLMRSGDLLIDSLPLPPLWQEQAACRSAVGVNFFPERGQTTKEAKAVCAACPVRAECLDYALANREKFGVWGGLSERQRRRVRQERAA